MVINCFENRNFMQPMRRFEGAWFFSFGGERWGGGGVGFFVFLVPIKFS
jgi:hypothetical protein